MCGIAGFTGRGSAEDLQMMLSSLAHRGPDGSGTWTDGASVYLGHRRLSIVDLHDGAQPMSTEDKSLVVIFNGEIYNHGELRRQLEAKGHKFKTSHSDTEVLLRGYREWGRELVSRLNGMWAFALLDRNNRQIWLSRDRFGKKPLFYQVSGGELVFSSELSSIHCHPYISRVVDPIALQKYFAHGYLPGNSALTRGVKKLPAGHNLVFDLATGDWSIDRYWRFKSQPSDAWLTHPEREGERLLHALSASVNRRLEADVPVGVFLSGGVDSSSIASLAVTAQNGRGVKTFSIGFDTESFDETPYSNLMAGLLGTDHYHAQFSVDKCVALTETVLSRLDEPMADGSLIPSYMMCQMAREHVTVALGGDGADELFAGYDPFRALAPARLYSKIIPSFAHRLLSGLVKQIPVSHKNMSLDFKMKRFLSGAGYEAQYQSPIWLSTLPIGHIEQLFGSPLSLSELFEDALDAWFSSHGGEIERTVQFYIELYLQSDILTKMDRAGMLNSLEVRSPFLDIDFVDLVQGVPAGLKFKDGITKFVLKRALSRVLPVDIIHRKKKGFGIPVGQWFKDKKLIIQPEALDGFVDTAFVKKLYAEHLAGKADWRNFLWAHLVLEFALARLR